MRSVTLALIPILLTTAIRAAAGEPEAVRFPLPDPSAAGSEKFARLLNAFLLQGGHLQWKHDKQIRPTGPFFVHDSGEIESLGTHGPDAVQVYYSPQVWDWMMNGSKGAIADGGMIVKVLYARDMADPRTFSADPTGFSVMVKDRKGSWDGWFYSDGGPLLTPKPEHAATFFDPNAGFALTCINCHASADNVESTFSSVRHVTGKPVEFLTSVSEEGLRRGIQLPASIHKPAAHQASAENKRAGKLAPHWNAGKRSADAPIPLPFWNYDHVPQGPRPDGHRQFVSSSNCMACHDAVQLRTAPPHMAYTHMDGGLAGKQVNLSPFGEWRYSMMGLSGRDPVFYAQLESERALHPELAAEIDNKCLSCHAVMGQRLFQQDQGTDALFTSEMALAAPGSRYAQHGALARDGVSCVVCHQMQPDGLGAPASYSGKFVLPLKPKEIFGPYEKVAAYSMEQSLGLTPKLGAHISESKACGSCHTVAVPVLDRNRRYTREEFDRLSNSRKPGESFHEQTTYLEWKNSSYSTEQLPRPATAQSCQDCHMPRTYNGEALKFKIANIEDETFPISDRHAPDDKLRMETRERYSRHTLQGINIFVLEMFNQNPWTLGVSRHDALFRGPDVRSGFETAIAAANELASKQSAQVEIVSLEREGQKLIAKVAVRNLTGHKLPTGVQFRRAFLEVSVASGERVLWASGATDEWGVIGGTKDGRFTPLATEFFQKNAHQPHHQTITSTEQVQIYEQLAEDSAGDLTTSFLSMKRIVKDNRLLPRGWKADGPDAEITRAQGGAKSDRDFNDGAGQDITTYEIPVEPGNDAKLAVTATLYYQSLPPYYLKQRFEHVDKPATQRLRYLVNNLDLDKSPAKHWKLKLAEAAARFPGKK